MFLISGCQSGYQDCKFDCMRIYEKENCDYRGWVVGNECYGEDYDTEKKYCFEACS